MNALTFKAAEEVFSDSIAKGITFAGHTLTDVEASKVLAVKQGGILDAPVGMEDKAGGRTASCYSHIKSIKGEICVNAVREGIADDLLCAKVFDNSTIEPAFIISLERLMLLDNSTEHRYTISPHSVERRLKHVLVAWWMILWCFCISSHCKRIPSTGSTYCARPIANEYY